MDYFEMARELAVSSGEDDKRSFLHGAIGVRARDNVIVSAKNGAVFSSSKDTSVLVFSHCEPRLLRKLGKGGVIYIVRVLKKNGSYAMSRPCSICRPLIKGYNTELVYYSISNEKYGVWNPSTDQDEYFDM
jgi:tRNA(Arg) A34 adenosine deaminase TadA